MSSSTKRRRSGQPSSARARFHSRSLGGDLANLLSVIYPDLRLGNMVLTDEVALRLKRVLKEQKQQSKLRSHGLMPRRKLLLVGPSGSGKTMTAAALAGELKLPLFTIRLGRAS